MATVIKGGEIITASDRCVADVQIEDGVVTMIARDIKPAAGDTVVDATGQYLLPGGIDVHTHFELPFMGTFSSDDFQTGTIAAAVGGTTSVIDFVIPQKKQPCYDALAIWRKMAEGKACIDYGFHMAVTDWNETIAEEIPRLIKDGITSFKSFMAYRGVLGVNDDELFSIMRVIGKNGGLVQLHCENGDVINQLQREYLAEGKTAPKYHAETRPGECEEEATFRGIQLAHMAKAPVYIVHLTHHGALARIEEALLRGQMVLTETCPQYLLLTKESYEEPDFGGAKYVMSPPLRDKVDNEALWRGIALGFIEVMATDHCPFDLHGQKDKGKDDFTKIPNGAPGVGDRVNLMHTYGVLTGRLSLNRFVELCSTAPAKIFGMYPRKGTIAVGSDGDIVVYDPKPEWVLSVKNSKHRCDYNTFEGFKLQGKPTQVFSGGRQVVKDGEFVGEIGAGRFVKRLPFNPTLATVPVRELALQP